MDTPFFSIIIPVYKIRQDYLETCVESIRNQSFRNLEIILVEDGSPDDCGILCDEYAKKDSRIKVIHQENQGVSVARNNGINAASGEWIMFVDADDWVADGCYQKLADFVSECQCEMLMFRMTRVYQNQMVAPRYPFEPRVYDTSDCGDKEALYRLAMCPPKSGNSGIYYSFDKVMRRDFLNEHNLRYPAGVPKSEDKVFILRCFEKLGKLRFVDEAFYFYRINAGSVCNRFSESADKDRLALAEVLLPIAERMDRELACVKGEKEYTVLSNDCKRFLFGIISDVLTLKFYHPDCPYSTRERNSGARAFIKTEPFYGCVKAMKYGQLSASAKLKKFMLQCGMVNFYSKLLMCRKKLNNEIVSK